MNSSRKILLTIFLLALGHSGCVSTRIGGRQASVREQLEQSETFRSTLPKTSDEPVKPQFPKILQSKLKNGLHVYVVPDSRLPIATISLVFRNGSASDPANLAGLIDITTNMLKEGAGTLTSLQLAEEFANLGTEVSTSTAKDASSISAAVLSNKIDRTLELISLMAQHPTMPAEDLDRVKLNRQSEIIAQMSMPAYAAQVSFLEMAYGEHHPYGHPTMGTLKTVGSIDVKEIKKAHAQYFGPNNAALVIVGDVSFAQIKKQAEKLFGKWQPIKHANAKISDPIPAKHMQTHLVGRPNTPQTFLLLGQPVANANDSDLAILEVMQQLLTGMPTSRLDANLREKKGWTYGVHSAVSALRGKGPMMVSASIQIPFGSDALQEILQEFEALKSTKVSADELSSAKNGLLRSFASRYTTLEKISQNIASLFVSERPLDFDRSYFNKLANVSTSDIMRVAQRVLQKDHMVAVAVGDLEAMQIPLAKMNMGIVTVEQEDSSSTKK